MELEAQNPAEKTTELVATPHDLGPNKLMDFDGGNILEVKPGTTLLNGKSSNFSGIFAMGMGTGSGVLGVGSVGIGRPFTTEGPGQDG
ncbi:hypothetical protein [Allorhizocola rhizosphaerae]|uniref:hypothetical protein n=1 Tax=Allorhizocola rhizosphaerae TaxID=1872709 RepID=UPI001B8D976F|nr:hypothetical protein [Allorhizocola rhizosphaerae]